MALKSNDNSDFVESTPHPPTIAFGIGWSGLGRGQCEEKYFSGLRFCPTLLPANRMKFRNGIQVAATLASAIIAGDSGMTNRSRGALKTGAMIAVLCASPAAFADGSATNSYWDTTTSGTNKAAGNNPNLPGVTGQTTKQLKAHLPAGFDPTIWAQSKSINGGFPYLIANPPQ
jgi:hypothetical protein